MVVLLINTVPRMDALRGDNMKNEDRISSEHQDIIISKLEERGNVFYGR